MCEHGKQRVIPMHRIRIIPETPGDRHPKYDPVIITVTWHQVKTTVLTRWNGRLLGQNSFPFLFLHSSHPTLIYLAIQESFLSLQSD